MNITEANATMRVLEFLAGNIDHCDEAKRQRLAHDLDILGQRAHQALHAGTQRDLATWEQQLLLVTFEGA